MSNKEFAETCLEVVNRINYDYFIGRQLEYIVQESIKLGYDEESLECIFDGVICTLALIFEKNPEDIENDIRLACMLDGIDGLQ